MKVSFRMAIIGLLIGLIPAAGTWARPIDSDENAETVQQFMAPTVLAMQGISSIGKAPCHPKTGEPIFSLNEDFVHCLMIGADTKEAADHFSALLPIGTQVKGVFITVALRGKPYLPNRRK